MIRISDLKLPVYKEHELEKKILKTLNIKKDNLLDYSIIKKSVDSRKKPDVFFVYTIDCKLKNEKKVSKKFKRVDVEKYTYPKVNKKSSPVIIGFGPAGLFAAYILSELGLKPIVLERGEDVDARSISVDKFWKEGILNPESNVQFGEGGAGTFSDGKLTSRSKDLRGRKVLEIFVENGAPEDILYMKKAHIGTDILKDVVKNMRNKIISMGGKVYFNECVKEIKKENQYIIKTNSNTYKAENIVLAIGHSSRDTFEHLYDIGMQMEQKSFAMGVRIEHHQDTINQNQYGSLDYIDYLGASDYKLTYQASTGRTVYSFCVCPGGMVVNSCSEENCLVVNGMSERKRDQKNINGALLVQINKEDYNSSHPLAGIEFQRKYEKRTYALGGSDYGVPIETVGSFVYNKISETGDIKPSVKPITRHCKLNQCLPEIVYLSLKEAIPEFGKKIKGFDADDVILSAIESRSSSPVRLIRDLNMESVSHKGIFPIGEGAGYAGGIVSSAIDGIRAAEYISKK